ncbi:MAG: hypothetical protein MUC47_11235, partial [Candidatus Kapabacteria bacterium]|nr:hypothetical protein [Candidatus Kapabacteria bacterium]
GRVLPNAIAPLIASAESFEQAFGIARLHREVHGTTDALFAVLVGVRKDSSKKEMVIREIRSYAKQSIGNGEIALAAEWMSDSSRKDHLVDYVKHLASKKRVEYPHVLARVLDETPVLATLTSSQIGLFAENVLARDGLWSFATNLVYRINVGDRQECSKAGEIVRVFAREMPRFSPYEHVSLTSVTFTLAEIAYAAGDTSAAYRLLADVRDHTVHRASSYWKSSKDPYWVVDVRGWAHAARFLMARWRMKEGKDEEAYHVLRDYQLTQESDEDADIAFVRVVASLKSKRHKQLLTKMIIERVATIKGKSNLLEIARQQLGITTPELPANINDDSKDIVLIVTGPGCSVCESLIQYLRTTVSGQNTKASIVYDVSSQSIIFTNAKVVRLSESVKNACVRRTSAFPTVFIVRGDRIIREYKGSSVELMRTLLAQDKK